MWEFTCRPGTQAEMLDLVCLISGYQHPETQEVFPPNMPTLIRYKQLHRTLPNENVISINEIKTIQWEVIKTMHMFEIPDPNLDCNCHFSEPKFSHPSNEYNLPYKDVNMK